MSLYHSPHAETRNLLLNVDFANIKSYNPVGTSKTQNLLLQSEDIHLSPWSSVNSATMTQTAVPGPFGTGLATKVDTSTTSPSLIYQIVPTSVTGTGQMICSIYAKADTSSSFTFNCYYEGDTEVNVTFNLSNGTTSSPLTSLIQNVGNGWYRCIIFISPREGSGTFFQFRLWPEPRATATAKGCLFWGAQLTNSYAPTTYVKTTSSVINFTTTDYQAVVSDTINNNQLILNNPSYYSISNGSIQFNRDTTAKIGGFFNTTATGNLTASNFLYNNFTWEILFRINDRWGGGYDANEGESAIAVYRGYHSGFMYYSGELRFHVWSGTTSYQTANWSLGTSGTEIIQGQWCHVAITKNGDIWTKYLNGNRISSLTRNISSSGIGVTNDLRFGSGNSGLSFSFFSKCNLALSRMYNTNLSDSEIKQNFNSIRGRYNI